MPGSDLKPGCTIPDLYAMIYALQGSQEFEARKKVLLSYLATSDCRVPIYFHDTLSGGFDFLLSENGLEFFIPARPDAHQELVRCYTYRRTGRRAIGTPRYLVSEVATDSPTGPSQLIVSTPNLYNIITGGGQGGDVVGPDGKSEKEEEEDRGEEPVCVKDILSCLEHFPLAESDSRTPRRFATDDYHVLTSAAYVGLMEAARCWQVEGSVYRGIMVELPRVVAVGWLEQLSCTKPIGSSYHQMFTDSGEGGLREIFRERLETSLPTAPKMKFEVHPNPTPGCEKRWKADDVMITDQGFYVPAPPATPSERDIYKDIMDGRAGQPVFTDSMKST